MTVRARVIGYIPLHGQRSKTRMSALLGEPMRRRSLRSIDRAMIISFKCMFFVSSQM